MKICRHKVTGRILEAQSNATIEILINNNKQYYPEIELEVLEMTSMEYAAAIRLQNEADMSPKQIQEKKIKEESNKILRAQAIAELQARGELPSGVI
jgi:hypothetical protein